MPRTRRASCGLTAAALVRFPRHGDGPGADQRGAVALHQDVNELDLFVYAANVDVGIQPNARGAGNTMMPTGRAVVARRASQAPG
jgi:hypothetical protein